MFSFVDWLFEWFSGMFSTAGHKGRYLKASTRGPKANESADLGRRQLVVARQFVNQNPKDAVDIAGFLKLVCHEGRPREFADARPPLNPETKSQWLKELRKLSFTPNSGFAQMYKYVDGWGGFLPNMSFDSMSKLKTLPKNQALTGLEQDLMFKILGDVPDQVTVLSDTKEGTKMVTSPQWADGFLVFSPVEVFWFPSWLDVLGVSLRHWWNMAQQFPAVRGVHECFASDGDAPESFLSTVYDFREFDPIAGKKGEVTYS